jgi:hypothetical protein
MGIEAAIEAFGDIALEQQVELAGQVMVLTVPLSSGMMGTVAFRTER